MIGLYSLPCEFHHGNVLWVTINQMPYVHGIGPILDRYMPALYDRLPRLPCDVRNHMLLLGNTLCYYIREYHERMIACW